MRNSLQLHMTTFERYTVPNRTNLSQHKKYHQLRSTEIYRQIVNIVAKQTVPCHAINVLIDTNLIITIKDLNVTTKKTQLESRTSYLKQVLSAMTPPNPLWPFCFDHTNRHQLPGNRYCPALSCPSGRSLGDQRESLSGNCHRLFGRAGIQLPFGLIQHQHIWRSHTFVLLKVSMVCHSDAYVYRSFSDMLPNRCNTLTPNIFPRWPSINTYLKTSVMSRLANTCQSANKHQNSFA